MTFQQRQTMRSLITRYRIEVKDGRPHMVLVVLEEGDWKALEGTADDTGPAAPAGTKPGGSAA
jgi:hypothetical protein